MLHPTSPLDTKIHGQERSDKGKLFVKKPDLCWLFFLWSCLLWMFNPFHTMANKQNMINMPLHFLQNNHLPNAARSISKRLVGSLEWWIVAMGPWAFQVGSCDCWVSWVESHLNSLGKESGLSSWLSCFQGCHFKHHRGCWMRQLNFLRWDGKMAKLQDTNMTLCHTVTPKNKYPPGRWIKHIYIYNYIYIYIHDYTYYIYVLHFLIFTVKMNSSPKVSVFKTKAIRSVGNKQLARLPKINDSHFWTTIPNRLNSGKQSMKTILHPAPIDIVNRYIYSVQKRTCHFHI